MQGKLYLCATPIGNLEDITLRVLRVLKEADLIAAEDTRNSIKLLNHFEIKTPMTSYHEYNKIEKGRYLIEQMKNGKNVALITDAGTPGISDPGEELVRMCHEEGVEVTSLPGASACVTALTMSGLPTRRFCFEAFLPSDRKEKQAVLDELKEEMRTIIIYEAPHRLVRTLQELLEVLGDRKVTVCRELTKKHETVFASHLEEALTYYTEHEPKGECVLVIEGKSRRQAEQESRQQWESLSVEEHMAVYTEKGMERKEAMKQVAKDRGVSKRVIYQMLLSVLAMVFLGGCAGGAVKKDKYVGVAQVLEPEARGVQVLERDGASVDISDAAKGYIIARYEGDAPRLNVQIIGPDTVTYKYNVTAQDGDTVIPLTEGEGEYVLDVYENIIDEQYAQLMSGSFTVKLESEYLPFLYPNQYVNFSADSEAVKKAEELAEGIDADIDVLQKIYDYVIQNITYDFDKAADVPLGYLPDVDETLASGTGICFDYAALMTAMLRSRGIPTRLDIGYTNDGLYHAWISTYLNDKGWVDDVIEFDGKSWELMDPTMAAAVDTESEKKKVVEDSSNYIVKYSR